MNKKVVLFDLDGTLLPMEQEEFARAYIYALIKKLAQMGLPASSERERDVLVKAVWTGTRAMMQNDGSKTNEAAFFGAFKACTGVDLLARKSEFDSFYLNEFQSVSAICGKNPLVRETVDALKGRGYRVAVATNPLFPLVANEQRLKWAGLELSEFEYCTCYENSSYCKPRLEYYEAILARLGVSAEECLMVGNDVCEDMVAQRLGMDVFLITDCLINADDEDIEGFAHGNWADFAKYMGLTE